MINQKRKFARIQWLIPCLFNGMNGSAILDHPGWGTIRNISLKGAELATRFPAQAGDTVYLTFKLGKSPRFENVSARIIHKRKRGIYYFLGVQFEENQDLDQLHMGVKSFLSTQAENL